MLAGLGGQCLENGTLEAGVARRFQSLLGHPQQYIIGEKCFVSGTDFTNGAGLFSKGEL